MIFCIFLNTGEMAEWTNAVASKAIIPCKWNRGFESPSLLHTSLKLRMGTDSFRRSVSGVATSEQIVKYKMSS